jgi:signal peptidase I
MTPDTLDTGRDAAPEAEASGSHLFEWVATFVLALALAAGSRAFLIEPFRIPSGSMLPTLLIGDHLFVNKFVYGPRVPLVGWRLPSLREPVRGEVVVFTVAKDGSDTHPADLRPELPREDFVKRIIGLPGDRIDLVDGVAFVNGEPFQVLGSSGSFEDDAGRELVRREVGFEGRRFEVLDDPEREPRRGSFVVEEGRYFVLGDNRDWSKDSREWGTVRREELKGPAFLLYWSWDFTGDWFALLDPRTWWRADVRWERVGSAIR